MTCAHFPGCQLSGHSPRLASLTMPRHCTACLQKPAIQSPVLSKALFDLYIGSDPVSPDAKESFGQGLAKLLSEK
jgi:hypothetical protein